MKNITKKALAAATAFALGFGLVGVSSVAAVAADGAGHWTPEGTPEPYYLWVMDTESVTTNDQVFRYDTGMIAAPSATNVEQLFTAPDDATTSYIFVAPRGKESSMSEWSSRVDIGFVPGTKQVMQPPASLEQFPSSTFAAVKAAGGDYSIGLAYTKNNGVTFVGLGGFAHIHITAGSADWTVESPTFVEDGGTDPVEPIAGQIGITSPVLASADGALSLSVPSGATATLGGAIRDAEGRSTSAGTLPTFSVQDERFTSKPGWTVNTAVAAFTGNGNTFDAKALSIAPAIGSTSTSTGVTKVDSLLGSSTAATFADAPAGTGTGKTDLGAELKLVAPLGTPEGTYTSTMTVTVVSK